MWHPVYSVRYSVVPINSSLLTRMSYSSVITTQNISPFHDVRTEFNSLTHSMEQSPSGEADWFSASQESPQILWNLKVHYHSYKCLPPVPVVSQINPAHSLPSHTLKIQFNIILPSMLGSFKWSLSLRLPRQKPVCTSPLPHTCYTPHSSHSSQLDQQKNIWWIVQIFRLLIMELSTVILPLLGPNIPLSTLLSNTLSLHSSLNVSNNVSNSYKTGKITVLHTLSFIFLDNKLEDQRFYTAELHMN
jgi:hypothetical protein